MDNSFSPTLIINKKGKSAAILCYESHVEPNNSAGDNEL